jgi:elongation factor P--(R)-beta-lysine ligase
MTQIERNALRYRLIRRAQVLRLLRQALDRRGYIEVETPARVRSAGTDVNIEAFSSEERFLITSPEFHMKRLLSQGLLRIYEICHCFRKGERTPLHNPEFSMLEFYAAGMSLEGMMQELEEILREVAEQMQVGQVEYQGVRCDLQPPWPRLSVEEAFQRWAGWSPISAFDEDRFYFDLVDKVDRHLGENLPAFLYHYPAPLAMLARLHPAEPRLSRRFELYWAGVEIANAFEELTEADEQRSRFEADQRRRQQEGKPHYPIDEMLLQALPDMPPCSGVAVGVDRLVMLLLGAANVDQVMAFTDESV